MKLGSGVGGFCDLEHFVSGVSPGSVNGEGGGTHLDFDLYLTSMIKYSNRKAFLSRLSETGYRNSHHILYCRSVIHLYSL
jgi:hypothetical protein